MSRERLGAKGEGMVFTDTKEVERALQSGALHLQAKIKVRVTEYEPKEDEDDPDVFRQFTAETTAGRVVLWNIVPKGLPFEVVNRTLTKKLITQLINIAYRRLGLKPTVIFCDQLMYLGFSNATVSGCSIGINDMVIPDDKPVSYTHLTLPTTPYV